MHYAKWNYLGIFEMGKGERRLNWQFFLITSTSWRRLVLFFRAVEMMIMMMKLLIVLMIMKLEIVLRFEEEEQIECQISVGVDNDRNLLFNSCRWEVVERNVFSLRGK